MFRIIFDAGVVFVKRIFPIGWSTIKSAGGLAVLIQCTNQRLPI
jgi:hypothetical protein